MADAVAARRDARRRKILENSQNRLQRISGKIEGDLSKGSPIRNLIPEESYEVPAVSDSSTSFRSSSSLNNGIMATGTPSLEVLSSLHNQGIDAAGDGLAELASELSAFTTPAPEQTITLEATLWNKLILYKFDVVLVSIMVQLLYSLSLLSFEETYFFLPLVAYVVTKIIWFPPPKSSNFANALLLLNGISVDRVERIMSVTRWVSMFSQDLCVYLFTTICMQALYSTIKEYLIT